ncbi:DnaJ -like protein dnj-20 [Trichinella spiralis]|uniref:DnaJ-like protein dnj-20 n=1 Tax=Trichinella spiralis TaxID=6334 RepID=A0A0V1AUD2_TRISP|nr:DnaJ -like protein dnj-20 [Trichinella spiralis]
MWLLGRHYSYFTFASQFKHVGGIANQIRKCISINDKVSDNLTQLGVVNRNLKFIFFNLYMGING